MAFRAASRLRGRGEGGDEVPGVPRRAHLRCRDGAPCDRLGQTRHGRNDQGALADPHIVKKIMEGREHEIRPCVGATYCLDRIYEGGEALCIHNAATGREKRRSRMSSSAADGPAKKIVVVGAGAGRPGSRAGRGRARTLGHRAGGDPARPAGKFGSPTQQPAPARTDRHRRLAACGTGEAGRRNPLRHMGREGRCAGAGAGRGRRRDRRPAAEPASGGRRRPSHIELGHLSQAP